MRRKPAHPRLAQGSALVFILIILMAGAAFLVSALRSNPQVERDKITADALAQAKEALIGYAATYRDTRPGEVFGYLPCPDTDNDGVAQANCGGTDVSVIGRLPWQTLGLPPLRDSSGECLWYAVSGRYKNNSPTAVLNWDTTGQFIIQDAAATVLANGVVAVVFAARGPINNQARTSGANECGGDNTNNINAYLDGNDTIYTATPVANADSTLTLSTVASIADGTNNDRGLWIAPNEIWERVRRRTDFATDITNLLNDVRDQAALDGACANNAATLDPPVPGSIVEAGVSGKTIGLAPAIAEACIGANQVTRMAVFNNWRNNVLYATCPSADVPCLTVNGDANCAGAVIFSGERANGRTRPSTAAIDYLEGSNLTAFTSAATVITGPSPYNWNASTQDIAVCIPPVAGGGPWPFEYPTQWNGVPPLNASEVAVGGTSDTTGTSSNDDVIINGNLGSWINLGSGNDELLVTGNFTGGGSFGAGDDTVKIGGNATATIDLGNGDDYLDIGGNSTAYVDSGTGNDKILIGGNASASISTGAGDDELHIQGSASGSIDVGSGSDKIRIEQGMSANINLGNDDDYLLIFGDAAGIQAGSGEDVVLIDGNATAWIDLGSNNDYLEILGNSVGFNADSGDDTVRITGNVTGSIDLGSGNDSLKVSGSTGWVQLGVGDDYLEISGNSAGLDADSGNDTVKINGNATNSINLGSGNDYLKVGGSSVDVDAGNDDDIVDIVGAATNTINLGSGNDYLRVGGTITWIDGGAGTDRIYLMAYNVTNCASLLTSRISANVEHVKVSDGMCRGSNFTFP
jgi:hypothetical protein